MKHLIIFCLIIFVGIFADKDPFCKEKHRFANPRECCLDPKLITLDIIEKCRIRMGDMSESEPNSYDNKINELEKNQYEYDQIDSHQLSVKPVVSNGIKRDTISKRRRNPFDLNEYGDSDEKIYYKQSSDLNSESSSESKEHSRKGHHRNKHHKDHHKCNYHKKYHGRHHHEEKLQNYHHDLSSGESNSLDSSSSDSSHNGGHRHHSDHHKHHHRRHHHGGHHHRGHHHRRHHHCRHHKGEQFQKQHGYQFNKFSCFMECVFNETGIIENKTVNMNNVNTYLTEVLQLNDDYLPIVTDAIQICGKNVADMRQKIQELPVMPMMPMISLMPHHGYKNEKHKSQKCKPWAGYLMMCIKAQMFINCPIENFRNDDMRCNNTREFMRSCPKESARIPYYFSNKRRSFSKD